MDIFDEKYDDLESSDSSDEGPPEPEMMTDDAMEDLKLGISSELANANYDAAGIEVLEEAETIKVADHPELMDEKVDSILNDVVTMCEMGYEPTEFQRVAVNALGGLRNVVLVSPTGSGKMNVPLLATLVLRKVLQVPKGVCIITQPLSCIMNQKINNDVCKAAVLTMSGDLISNGQYEDEGARLSCQLKDLLDGVYPAIFCHPESVDSKLGQLILRELQKRGRLILVCLDEVHQSGKGYWDAFRPSMLSSSAGLRYVRSLCHFY